MMDKDNTSAEKIAFTKSQILTIDALLGAIIIVFMVFPAIGAVKLAFMPIVAVIISAELIGLKNGFFMGLLFGIVSFASSYITPSLLSYAFHNPLISILPRAFIGISAYGVSHCIRKLLPKAGSLLAYSFASAAGVVTNTTLVLGMILLFHFGTTFSFNSTSLLINWKWLSAILISNSVVELAICTVITPPLIATLKKVLKKSR